ncbi:MAG TPA: helix-turn-helix domain-containing protein [Vicinamibacterales bacterium]|nr:helix-turn-helix domain-containing protein [Vicinamibacterales bacterium]
MSSIRPTKTDVVVDFRRGQIVDAARQSFLKQGLAATTVEAIARTAGVAKGTVYLYFASKDELLREILAQDLQEFHDSTVPAVRGGGSIEHRCAAFVRQTLEFFDRKRDFFEHCHLEMSPTIRKQARTRLGLIFAAQTEAWRDVLADTVRGARRADLDGRAHAIVSLAHGLALQRLRGWHASSVADTVASACHLMLKGVTRA